MAGALPNAIVIGAMKCGTTALHRYLHAHPMVRMASGKEVNFFFGADTPVSAEPGQWWREGQWHRGVPWYASLFDRRAPVRGETSPGYTSPDHPGVAARMRAVVPEVRLLFLVRDPFARAVSQYLHHRREGSEHRPAAAAILDATSQYVARSRYHERLLPFLRCFAPAQILVVVQERLLTSRRHQLRRVYAHVGADPDWWGRDVERRWHVGGPHPELDRRLRAAVIERIRDDVDRLRTLTGDDIPEWRV